LRASEQVVLQKMASSVVVTPPPDEAPYTLWKRNVPLVYDSLVNSHYQWSSMSVHWGPLVPTKSEGSKKTPPRSVQQVAYFSTRSDGEYDSETCTYRGEPSLLTVATIDIPLPHSSRISLLGKFRDEQKSTLVSITKQIIHRGEINSLRSIVSHSINELLCFTCFICRACPLPGYGHIVGTHTDSPNVYIWNTERQPNRYSVSNAQASVPDLM
jgi:histone-binding protein RBBP4